MTESTMDPSMWRERAQRAEAEVDNLRMKYEASQGALSDLLTEHRVLVEAVDADVVRTLQQFADHDLHGLIPHSEIANQWYHCGLDAAQQEASEWAERIGMESASAPVSSGEAGAGEVDDPWVAEETKHGTIHRCRHCKGVNDWTGHQTDCPVYRAAVARSQAARGITPAPVVAPSAEGR